MRINNSEILKYIWKESSKHVLITIPALILALTLATYKNMGGAIPLFAYLLAVFFWGSAQAINSILDEINEGTWDLQRLSPVTPLKIVIGKMFGSTIYAWYIGLFSLAIAIIADAHIDYELEGVNLNLKNISTLIISGLFAHAVALFIASSKLANKSYSKKVRSLSPLIILVFFLSLIYASAWRAEGVITWYHIEYSLYAFSTISILVFLAWAIFGTYRIIKQDLMYKVTPVGWLSFLLFIIFYQIGFIKGDTSIKPIFAIATFISFIAIYFALLTDNVTITSLRLLMKALNQKNITAIAIATPKFIVSILVFIPAILLGIGFAPVPLLISMILFIWRDVAIILFFKLSPNNKRSELTAIFYLLILYCVLPFLLGVMKLELLFRAFIPFSVAFAFNDNSELSQYIDNTLVLLILITTQTALATMLLIKRWKEALKHIETNTAS